MLTKRCCKQSLLLFSRAQLAAMRMHLSFIMSPPLLSLFTHSHRAASVFARCVFFHVFYQHNGFNFSLLYATLTVAINYSHLFCKNTPVLDISLRERGTDPVSKTHEKSPLLSNICTLIRFYNLDCKYQRAQLAPVYYFLSSFSTEATLNFLYSRLDL